VRTVTVDPSRTISVSSSSPSNCSSTVLAASASVAAKESVRPVRSPEEYSDPYPYERFPAVSATSSEFIPAAINPDGTSSASS
jgi:hypothetical protein